jgi:ubiquinone/menaquinone biosynthesis C-methylase UbiE
MLENNILAHYGKIEYWEDRYTRRSEPFDWYNVYENFKDKITKHITKESKILNVGCGNSRLSEDLYDDGYEDIQNIDFSTKVIQQMEERCKVKCPKMVFKVMDVLDMKDFQTGEFNVVIDKGTLDSVLCGDNAVGNAEKMIMEIYRVLSPGGKYIVISYGDSEHRKKYFEGQNWNVAVEKIIKPATSANANLEENDPKNYHFIYIMTKQG